MDINNCCWVNPLVEEGMAHVGEYLDAFDSQDFIRIIRTEKFDLTDEEGFAAWKRERLNPESPLVKELGYRDADAPAIFESGLTHLREIYDDKKIQELINIIRNDRFDYTEWRRDNLFPGMSIDDILDHAEAYERLHGKPKIRGPINT
ncbi:MAG: hypothetical protein LBL98_08430 [Ruminococcus sp.]|jgi:hypothetical protein|nr:hypothetical protein [Ruminococcus sp.]